MNKSESSAILNLQDSPAFIDLTHSPLDAPSPDVKSLVSAEAEVPAVSMQATVAQASVATAHPVGDIIVHPAGAVMVPPARRRPFYPHIPHPHIRPVHLPSKVHTFDSFSYTSYRYMWLSSFLFSAGFWLQVVIVGWLTYQLTQSALLTSIAMGLDALPILLAGPLGGVIVDTWDKRKLMTVVLAYQTLLALGFGISVIAGGTQAWHIFAFVFLMGISWIITDPARMSIIPSVVPRHNLVNAFALNSLAFSLTRLAAPALGGVILAVAGAGAALLIEALFLAAASAMMLGLRLPAKPRTFLNARSTINDIKDGAAYIKSNRLLSGLFLFGLLPPVLIIPFFHGLLPVYAAEVFNAGPTTLGLLMSSIGAGAILGTLTLASMGDTRRNGRIMLGCVALAALSMIALAMNSDLRLAYPIIMLGSIGVMGYFSISMATVQGMLPDGIRGRVTGIYMLTFGLMPVGSLMAGIVAQSMGASAANLIAATIVLAVLGCGTFFYRDLWQLE